MTSLLRLTHFTQCASFIPFSKPVPAISNFVLLILRPEERERESNAFMISNVFMISVAEFTFFVK